MSLGIFRFYQHQKQHKNRRTLINDELCMQLSNIEDIQKGFDNTSSIENKNYDLNSEKGSHSTIGNQYKTTAQNIQNDNENHSQYENNISIVKEYDQNQERVQQDSQRPKKRLNIVLTNGQLIKIKEERIKDTKGKLNNKIMSEHAKQKSPPHKKNENVSTHTSFKKNPENKKKNRGILLDKVKYDEQIQPQEISQMNKIAEHYGGILISTIFQSLLIHNIEALYQQKSNPFDNSSDQSQIEHLSSKQITYKQV